MIIGAKRKEENIKMRRYGMYENYIKMSSLVKFIGVYKSLGKWQIWEMINNSAGQPIGGYRTKKKAIEIGKEIAVKCNLQFIVG